MLHKANCVIVKSFKDDKENVIILANVNIGLGSVTAEVKVSHKFLIL